MQAPKATETTTEHHFGPSAPQGPEPRRLFSADWRLRFEGLLVDHKNKLKRATSESVQEHVRKLTVVEDKRIKRSLRSPAYIGKELCPPVCRAQDNCADGGWPADWCHWLRRVAG